MKFENKKIDPTKRSNTEFGLLFTLVFLIISVYPCISYKSPNYLFLFLSIFLLLISVTVPMILLIPNKIWMKFGYLLGYITTPIFLFVFYIFLFIPIGFILKAVNKDSLNLKFKDSSTWVIRKNDMQSLKNQF
tara:strand:- start:339 stop:737 length:399 start_codon:yes stop_codon:yes gene_type:complete